MTFIAGIILAFAFINCDNSYDDEESTVVSGGSGDNHFPDDPFPNEPFTIKSAAGWNNALSIIKNGGNNKDYTITVTGDFSVPGAGMWEYIFGNVSGVTITLQGYGTISLSSAGCLLSIYHDQTVVVRDVTLRGYAANGNAVVYCSGNFRMEGNATVTGNIGNCGVYIDNSTGATFTMQDNASVTGNTSPSSSGGVVTCGSFTMKDNASVMNNTSSNSSYSGGAGGVEVRGGTFIMQDNAKVINNTSSNSIYGGGGVYVDGGTFTMLGGMVSGNTAISGGGVFVYHGTFYMQNSAMVSGNTASAGDGGGIMVGVGFMEAAFTMQGGTVSGNYASGDGGGVYASGAAFTVITKTGGTIYGSGEGTNSNTAGSGQGHTICQPYYGWRNTTAGPSVNVTNSDFWLND